MSMIFFASFHEALSLISGRFKSKGFAVMSVKMNEAAVAGAGTRAKAGGLSGDGRQHGQEGIELPDKNPG